MSRFARWGWLIAAMDALFVLANLFCIVFLNGGPLNWVALVVCTVFGVLGFRQWRGEVERERRWTR